jgi:hypothetical protein
MPHANRYFLPGHVWHITHPSGDEFQSFQWFDGLTMSGFILNRFAPFKSAQRWCRSKHGPEGGNILPI